MVGALTAGRGPIGYRNGSDEADQPELFASATEPGHPVAASGRHGDRPRDRAQRESAARLSSRWAESG